MTRCEILDVLAARSDLVGESRYDPHGQPAPWDASAIGRWSAAEDNTSAKRRSERTLLEGVWSAMPHSRTFNLEKLFGLAQSGARVHGPNGLLRCQCTQRDQEANYILLCCIDEKPQRCPAQMWTVADVRATVLMLGVENKRHRRPILGKRH